MEEKNNVKVEYQISSEYLDGPSDGSDLQASKSDEVNKVTKEEIIEIEATNEDAKKVYEEAYADRYEYFIKKRHLTPEKADKRARGVAAHTVIMSSLDTRRDYIMTDTIEYENLKNYDVYIPTTIVGCLRHPIMIKQVYKKINDYGEDYQVAVEWYDEETDTVCNDVWTPPIKSPEYGTQWSGDTIVPYEIAVALKDCYDDHFSNKLIDKTYSRAEHYYIHKHLHDEDGWSYDTGEKVYKQGDLITGQELKELHNCVVGEVAVYAPTYLDVMVWMTKCTRNEYAFVIDCCDGNDVNSNAIVNGIFYKAKFLYKDSHNILYNSFEECCIDTIDWIYKQGGFHPFYTWYDEKLTERTVTKIFDDGFWTAEECELYTGISPIVKSKELESVKKTYETNIDE